MTTSRRLFLAQASLVAGSAVLKRNLIATNVSGQSGNTIRGSNNAVIICHTNGINGNMGPVYKNVGGLRQIRTQLKNESGGHLLLDAGSFLTTRGDFDQQKHIVEMMNSTGYKAAAISGMDFSGDSGQLAELFRYMQFSLINCNHKFNPGLKSFIRPYLLIKTGGLKIGVTGVCLPIKGAAYFDPIECANRTAQFLKENERGHLVICFSNLGFGKGETVL